MPTVTLRPDSDLGFTGFLRSAGSSFYGCISDNQNTYVYDDTGYGGTRHFEVGLSTVAMPVGAVAKEEVIRAKCRSTTSTVTNTILLTGGTTIYNWSSGWSSLAMSEFTSPTSYVNLTQAQVDGLWLQFSITSGSASIEIEEAYVDVLYANPPTTTVTGPTGVVNGSTATFAWTHTAGTDGSGQAAWKLRLFTAAQYTAGGFNPETSTAAYTATSNDGTTSYSVPVSGGTTYRAYVLTAQSINGGLHWANNYSYTGFTTSVTATITQSWSGLTGAATALPTVLAVPAGTWGALTALATAVRTHFVTAIQGTWGGWIGSALRTPTYTLYHLSSPIPVKQGDFVGFSIGSGVGVDAVKWVRLTNGTGTTLGISTRGSLVNGVPTFRVDVTGGSSTYINSFIELLVGVDYANPVFTLQRVLAERNHLGTYFDGNTVRGGWLLGTATSVSDFRWVGSANLSPSIFADDYERTKGIIALLLPKALPITEEDYSIAAYNAVLNINRVGTATVGNAVVQ